MQEVTTYETKEVREFASYTDMQVAHQKDVNEFPMIFLFGNKNDEEIKAELAKIGATKLAECVHIGAGAIMRKADVPAWTALGKRHTAEKKRFSETESNLVQMIYSEMCNHEYGCTCDKYDTLQALGKTERDLTIDERFRNAWKKAEKRCFADA